LDSNNQHETYKSNYQDKKSSDKDKKNNLSKNISNQSKIIKKLYNSLNEQEQNLFNDQNYQKCFTKDQNLNLKDTFNNNKSIKILNFHEKLMNRCELAYKCVEKFKK